MILTLHDDGTSFRVRVSGEIRWNDRLGLCLLERRLRATTSRGFVLDAASAREADLGAFGGIAATASRMALGCGLLPSVLAPAGRAAA